MKKKYIAFLISAVVCIEIVAGAYVFFFFCRKEIHEKCPLEQVASRCEGVYSMPQDVLQGLLALDQEEKQDVSNINLQLVQKRLEQCPAVQRARVRKLSSGTLVIDYALREPLFLLGEYHNIAVDRENCSFPLEPYFPNIQVPVLFLANKDLFSICLEVERAFSLMSLRLAEVDGSDMDALGLFRREIRVRACKEIISLSSTERGRRDIDDRDDGKSELLPRNDYQQIDGRSQPNREIISLQALKAQPGDLVVRLPVDTITLALQRLSLILKQYPEYSGTIDLRYPGVAYLEQFFSKGSHDQPIRP